MSWLEKTRKGVVVAIVAAALVLAACGGAADGAGGQPAANPTPSQVPTTGSTERVELQVQQAMLRQPGAGETELVAVVVIPDTCTEPRHAVSRADSEVLVTLWGERPVGVACAQVISEREIVVPLGSVAEGTVVRLNGAVVMRDDTGGAERPADEEHATGPVYVEEIEVRVGEGRPAPVEVVVRGALPDACSELVEPATITVEGTQVTVRLASQRPRDLMCAQVLRPFETTLDLGVFEPGTYTLVVNDLETTFVVEGS